MSAALDSAPGVKFSWHVGFETEPGKWYATLRDYVPNGAFTPKFNDVRRHDHATTTSYSVTVLAETHSAALKIGGEMIQRFRAQEVTA